MKILTLGHPLLLQKSLPVNKEEVKKIENIVKSMFAVLEKKNGLGLAAPQVGVLKRIFIVNLKNSDDKVEKIVCINPEIVSESLKRTVSEEGCLSIPGIYGPVERAISVKLKFFDLSWNEHEIKAENLFARVIQHEYDHLEGKLFIHRMSPVYLKELNERLENLEKETQKLLDKNINRNKKK